MEQKNEYAAYVHRLQRRIPEMSTLSQFLQQAVPHDWIKDEVTIYDLQECSWKKTKSCSVSENTDSSGTSGYDQQSHGEDNFLQMLQDYPNGTKTRIICVDQLTPTTTKLLGLKYDLSGDFFNDHLPGSISSRPLATAKSIFHFDFEQTYSMEEPFGKNGIFAGEKYDKKDDIKYDFLWSSKIFSAQHRHYVQPEYDTEIGLKKALFTVRERVSLYTGDCSGIRMGKYYPFILLFYPVIRPLYKYILMENDDHYDPEIHTELNVIEGRELVPGPRSLEGLRSSRAISTATRFCNEMEWQLKLQNSEQIYSPYLWLYPLFQILEQKASQEIYYTINKLNDDEQQNGIDDRERVWKQANALARSIAARQVRLRSTIKHMDYLDEEVVHGSSNVTMPAPNLLESTRQWNRLKRRFNEISEESHDALCRAEKITSTFLAYVQLDESRQAIKQTESVRRLTNLAFVFLPLSLVAGIFSASIQDMDGHRSAKVFIVSCILTTAISIIAALTLEQYFYVWFSWPFQKWRAWVFDWVDVEGSDRGARLMRRSRGWVWVVFETGLLIKSWVQWQLYAKRLQKNASKARQEERARKRGENADV